MRSTVARKEAERRKKNREAGVKAPTYTDEKTPRADASPSPKPSGNAPGASPSAASAEPQAGRDEAEERARQEQIWRGRKASAVARRDEAKRS